MIIQIMMVTPISLFLSILYTAIIFGISNRTIARERGHLRGRFGVLGVVTRNILVAYLSWDTYLFFGVCT